MKIRVADFIADFLVAHGITHNFTVTGGGAMHLNDALGHKEGLQNIYNHHEQASAIAAEAYSRLTGRLACLCVTSGPGGTNAITGVVGAWLDSIPMLVLSGQVKREMTVWSCPELPLRQLGDQEFNIAETVRNFTKYSVMVTDANQILYHLEKALYLCRYEKGGPVWLDIPLDIQGAQIEPENLLHFNAADEGFSDSFPIDPQQAAVLLEKLQDAKAPLILAGSAIRYSGAVESFLKLIRKLGIPVVTAWAANDVLDGNDEHFIGIPGTLGTRAGNFAVQQCDLLLSLGSRMNVRTVGYNKGDFAKNAYKIMVDICDAELQKPTYTPDWGIRADVKSVIECLLPLEYKHSTIQRKWLEWCQTVRDRFPVVRPEYHDMSRRVNPYVFTDILFRLLSERDIIVCSNGSSCVIPIQVNGIRQGQRLLCNSGCAAMGYGLPAALGTAIAVGGRRTICLEGDGSIMMNLQELPTARYHNLNLKIFIYNNHGYHSIRQSQGNNFERPLVGVDEESGVAIPDFSKVALAFDIPYYSITTEPEAEQVIRTVLAAEGVVICEVFVDETQNFSPKSVAKVLSDGRIVSPSIDDMAPFLPQEEYEEIGASWKDLINQELQ